MKYNAKQANRPHVCDTYDPQRPCCWAARRKELEAMEGREPAQAAQDKAATEQQIKDGTIWR
jgi:hypothetical protein